MNWIWRLGGGIWALTVVLLLSSSCGDPQSKEPVRETVHEASVHKDASERIIERTAERIKEDSTAPDTPKSSCKQVDPIVPTKNFFTDISKASGIQKNNFIRTALKKIPINDHSRLGFVDINGDGYDDIVVHSLFPNPQAGIPFDHLVFLNKGDGTFEDFSAASGLKKVQAAFFLFGDIDNDGDQDCFAGLDIPLQGHTNQIYINDGKGHFTLKAKSGVDVRNLLAMSAVFGDFNNDGKLDLYIGSGGTSYRLSDSFFVGNGDGTFVNRTRTALPNNASLSSNGVVTCDFDNDGDLDIVVSTYGVSNLLGHNILWQNDGKGNFTNVATAKGFDALPGGNYYMSSTHFGGLVEPGKTRGKYVGSNGFGVDCKDVNNDGLYDIFLTAISHPNESVYSRKWSDPTQLLINQGSKKKFSFFNEFILRKLSFNEGDIDGAMHDFDNDGRIDLSISRENKYERSYTKIEQKAWFGLYHQQPNGQFKSLGPVSGINSIDAKNASSAALCDAQKPCPTGEVCLLKRCRLPCKKDEDCTSPDEFCGSFWDSSASKTVQFCRLSIKMKGAQNHAWSDIDRDGDLDLLVGGRDKGGGRPNFLFRNEIGSKNRWIAFKLVGDGVKVNRDAIGARVSLMFKDSRDSILSREVQSSRGTYNSLDTRVLHFGLAALSCTYTLRVRWPNGKTVEFPSTALRENRFSTIRYPDTLE